MIVCITLPDDVSHRILEKRRDLSRCTLEALALESYRDGLLTEAEVQRMLDLPSRWQTEDFLKSSQAYLDYSESDLQQDIEAIRELAKDRDR